MRVTAKQLRDKKACEDQVLVFKKEWPRGVRVTFDSLQRAAELELDLDWFAAAFLPAPAWVDYCKATEIVRADYSTAIAVALVDYCKATEIVRAHNRALAPALALADYIKATAPALADYRKAIALALHQTIKDYGL